MAVLAAPQRILSAFAALGLAAALAWPLAARAAEPIRIGCSMAMTGGVAGIGKQVLLALEIWRDDVNAAGGLLGRPVELLCYDDQSNPANVPGIYTKLVNVDKVDLLIGPYATNMVAPVIPVLMQSGRMTVGILANAANGEFHYDKYFSMNATGPEPERSYAEGFFALAAAQRPRPRTVALVSVDAEYGRNAVAGARQVIAEQGFTIVYDRSYPPANTDFAPTMRAVQAAGADLVYVAAYPPDTVGIVRAANEIGLDARMFGGAMVGLLVTAVKLQLGPAMNGIVNGEVFLPAKTFDFKGTARLIQQYQARAQGQGVDPLGYTFPPFGYAAGQVLADAVAATGTLDHAKLAQYIHTHGFETVVGPIAFGKDGEWTEARRVFTQFRNVQPNDVEQFRDTRHEEIVWPDAFKTADIIYPYGEARK